MNNSAEKYVFAVSFISLTDVYIKTVLHNSQRSVVAVKIIFIVQIKRTCNAVSFFYAAWGRLI